MDRDHSATADERRRGFLNELKIRAEVMGELAQNELQQGRVLLDWTHDGIRCQLLPDDRQGILRISIGGGPNLPVVGDYCNIRGDIGQCIKLLERVTEALKRHPAGRVEAQVRMGVQGSLTIDNCELRCKIL